MSVSGFASVANKTRAWSAGTVFGAESATQENSSVVSVAIERSIAVGAVAGTYVVIVGKPASIKLILFPINKRLPAGTDPAKSLQLERSNEVR